MSSLSLLHYHWQLQYWCLETKEAGGMIVKEHIAFTYMYDQQTSSITHNALQHWWYALPITPGTWTENRRNWHILIPDMCGINLHTSPLHNPYKYPIPHLHAMHGVWEGDTEIMNFSKTFNTMYLSGFWIWDDPGLTNLREWMSIV